MAVSQTKSAAPRYSIAEWYGNPITLLSIKDRKALGEKAQLGFKDAAVQCPFRTKFFGKDMLCNKAGGVCCVAKYSTDTTVSPSITTVSDDLACLCPSRLLDRDVFKRIGQAVLGTEDVYLVREVPFLQNVVSQSAAGRAAKAGRIDFVLVAKGDTSNWCAVETQSVYFSGDAMEEEFKTLAFLDGPLVSPVGQRRPDYRSSVPKRLSPQLMLKVPHLGKGKYLAVVVDRFVQGQMGPLEEVQLSDNIEDPEELRLEKLALSEVIWFIVTLSPGKQAEVTTERYATLAKSIKALDSALPIPANRFSKGLEELIADNAQWGDKVIQLF